MVSFSLGSAAEDLRNWFNDPFVQLSSQVKPCPLPAGPYVSEKERLAQSHRRAEKGTTAWLAGESERPKAYAYDVEIVRALMETARSTGVFRHTTLWATVQGRVVYLEGCVAPGTDVVAVEAMVRRVPGVQQAIAIVRTDPKGRTPYRIMPRKSAYFGDRR